MRVLVPLAARSAHRVLADSQSTKRDLVRRLRVPAGKIDVVPLGIGAPVRRPSRRTARRCASGWRSARSPVVLSLSAKRPHKNLSGLLDALARLAPERRPVLVLPGYPTPHEAELRERATALGLDADVRFLGWTSEADIEGLFKLARAFVFPSFYEGFGLPVLEAMARGVPVACSRPRVAARGGRRRRAALRPRRPRGDRVGARAPARRPRSSRSGSWPPGAPAPRSSPGRARRS